MILDEIGEAYWVGGRTIFVMRSVNGFPAHQANTLEIGGANRDITRGHGNASDNLSGHVVIRKHAHHL